MIIEWSTRVCVYILKSGLASDLAGFNYVLLTFAKVVFLAASIVTSRRYDNKDKCTSRIMVMQEPS